MLLRGVRFGDDCEEGLVSVRCGLGKGRVCIVRGMHESPATGSNEKDRLARCQGATSHGNSIVVAPSTVNARLDHMMLAYLLKVHANRKVNLDAILLRNA